MSAIPSLHICTFDIAGNVRKITREIEMRQASNQKQKLSVQRDEDVQCKKSAVSHADEHSSTIETPCDLSKNCPRLVAAPAGSGSQKLSSSQKLEPITDATDSLHKCKESKSDIGEKVYVSPSGANSGRSEERIDKQKEDKPQPGLDKPDSKVEQSSITDLSKRSHSVSTAAAQVGATLINTSLNHPDLSVLRSGEPKIVRGNSHRFRKTYPFDAKFRTDLVAQVRAKFDDKPVNWKRTISTGTEADTKDAAQRVNVESHFKALFSGPDVPVLEKRKTKLQGRSHPLTKLKNRGFYNTM